MNKNNEPIEDQNSGMQELVQAACIFESLQRHAPMEPADLRVQETVAEFILFMEPGARTPQLRD